MKPRSESGFSLIELMIAIAVLAILAAVALPALRTTIQNNRLTTQANDLLTAFQFARSEALRVNGDVIVCASSNLASCGGGWQQGWIVIDPNAPGDPGDPTSDPEPIRAGGPLGGDTTVAGPTQFTFQARGAASAGGTLTLTVPACRAQQVRIINVEPTGRVNIRQADCP
ncbi:MAG: prepilin-type N-terminal cleavage/methylation domain-containing protein [Wenzhouxiangella sp.]|nr:MAG: prepilin-type N-terminal cleavage/methylation domain-containing protein [Wenzhouxiangella sp.]